MTLPRTQIFIPNSYYHVYNRGHNKQSIFLHWKDYARYCTRLKEYLNKHPVTLLAYCLMPNHIHLLLKQEAGESIEKFIHRLHTAYTMYFNKKYERVGSVFQGRFKAKLIETDEYLLHVSRYIHQNPLEIMRAQGPALKLELYNWSSYGEYLGLEKSPLSQPNFILNFFGKNNATKENQIKKYQEFVEETSDNLSDEHLADISNGLI